MSETIFVAAITTKSKEKLVIPINWVKSFNPTDLINHVIDHENDFLVFYSKNRKDVPDFNLPVEEIINGRGCYTVKFFKILDDESACEEFISARRNILPFAYNEIKSKRKNIQIPDTEQIGGESIDDAKEQVRLQIQEQLRKMNDMNIDLSDDEIDDLQNIIGMIDSEEEREFYFTTDDPMPEPFTSKIDPEVFERYAAIPNDIEPMVDESGEKSAEIEGAEHSVCTGNASSMKSIRTSNSVFVNVISKNVLPPKHGNMEPIAEESASGFADNHVHSSVMKDRHECLSMATVVRACSDGSNGEKSKSSENVTMAAENVAQHAAFGVGENQHMKRNVPHLIPVSKVGKKAYEGMDSSVGMFAPHVSRKYNYVRDTETGSFVFNPGGITLRPVTVQCVIAWNTTSPFYSVIYDKKFVALLMIDCIGKENLSNGLLPKKELSFIKDMFMQRIGGDVKRAMRFGDYVNAKRDQVMEQTRS